MMWWMSACLTVPVERPEAAPEDPDPGRESLAGVVQDAVFDRSGFECWGARCVREAEVAGLSGQLIVRLCGDRAHQIAFRSTFHIDAIAAQLDRPGESDLAKWVVTLRGALDLVGFQLRELTEEELEAARTLDPARLTITGRKLSPAEFMVAEHADGRIRSLSIVERPGPASDVMVYNEASVIQVTLSTAETAPCTAGL